VPPSLTVELNRDRLHDISVAPSFAADGPFEIRLVNRGESVHTHLHLDDDLSRVAALGESNHYVESGKTRSVPVRVRRGPDGATGRLKVVTGYGAEQEFVTVTVEPPEPESTVDVDESLSKPPAREEAGEVTLATALGDVSTPVLVVGVAVVLLALIVGVVAQSALLLVAAGVALGAMGAVAVLSQRERPEP